MIARGLRRGLLTGHLVCALGWLGAALSYLALAMSVEASNDPESARAAYLAMATVGWSVIVPLALAALATGVLVSVTSPWGLFTHWWVVLSLALTTLATAVTVIHMPTVSTLALTARDASPAALNDLPGDLAHPAGGLVVLLAITILNVYKPAGRLRPPAPGQVRSRTEGDRERRHRTRRAS